MQTILLILSSLFLFLFYIPNVNAKCQNYYQPKEQSYIHYKTETCLLYFNTSKNGLIQSIYYQYKCNSNNGGEQVHELFYTDPNCSQFLVSNNNSNVINQTKYDIICDQINNDNNNNNNNGEEQCQYAIIETLGDDNTQTPQNAIVINECTFDNNSNSYYEVQCNETHYWYLKSNNDQCIDSGNSNTYHIYDSSINRVVQCSKISSISEDPFATTDLIFYVPDYYLTLIPPNDVDNLNITLNNAGSPSTTAPGAAFNTTIIFLVPPYDLTVTPPTNYIDVDKGVNITFDLTSDPSNTKSASTNNNQVSNVSISTDGTVKEHESILINGNKSKKNNNKKHRLSKKARIALAVSLTIIMFSLIIGLIFFAYHSRQKKLQKQYQTINKVSNNNENNNIKNNDNVVIDISSNSISTAQ